MTLHRFRSADEWREVRIICALPAGYFLVEETDRVFPGRFAARRGDLREIIGAIEDYRSRRPRLTVVEEAYP